MSRAGLAMKIIVHARIEKAVMRYRTGNRTSRTVGGHVQKAVLLALVVVDGRPVRLKHELAEMCGASPSAVTRAVAAMIDHGIVELKPEAFATRGKTLVRAYGINWQRLLGLVPPEIVKTMDLAVAKEAA